MMGKAHPICHCQHCPVKDFCFSQTSATCPLVKLLENITVIIKLLEKEG